MATARNNRTNRAPKKRSGRDWADRFLLALAKTGVISYAANLAKVGRRTVYERRDNDEAFAAAMAEALEQSIESLEVEARRRAHDGTKKPVFHQGVQCGSINEYSDTLLIFLLKAHRPDKYRERMTHEHSGPGGSPIQVQVYIPDNGRGDTTTTEDPAAGSPAADPTAAGPGAVPSLAG